MTEEKQLNVGLLILRVTLGIVFIAHGYLKVFTFGIRHAMEVFEAHTVWHINMIPGWFAPAAAVIEWTGGITPANPTAAGNTASSSSSAVSLFFWSDLENTQSRTLMTIDSKAIAPNSVQSVQVQAVTSSFDCPLLAGTSRSPGDRFSGW